MKTFLGFTTGLCLGGLVATSLAVCVLAALLDDAVNSESEEKEEESE